MTFDRDTLAYLLTELDMMPREEGIAAMCQMISEGYGTILTPATRGIGSAPATHLFEVTFAGVTATGDTLPEAIAHWRSVATRLIVTEDAA